MTTYIERLEQLVIPALKEGMFIYTNFGELHPALELNFEQSASKPAGLPDWQVHETTQGEKGEPIVLRHLQLVHCGRKPEGQDWQVFKPRKRGTALGFNLTVPLGIGEKPPEHEKLLARDLQAKILFKPVYVIALGRCHYPDAKGSAIQTDCVLMDVFDKSGKLLWSNPFVPSLEETIQAVLRTQVNLTHPHVNAPVPAAEPDVVPHMVPRSGPLEATPAGAIDAAVVCEKIFRDRIRAGVGSEEIINLASRTTGYTPNVIGRALDQFKVRLQAEEMFKSLDNLQDALRPDQIIHRVAIMLRHKDDRLVTKYFEDYKKRRGQLDDEDRKAKVLPVAEMARTLGLDGEDLLLAVVEDSGIPYEEVLPILRAAGYVDEATSNPDKDIPSARIVPLGAFPSPAPCSGGLKVNEEDSSESTDTAASAERSTAHQTGATLPSSPVSGSSVNLAENRESESTEGKTPGMVYDSSPEFQRPASIKISFMGETPEPKAESGREDNTARSSEPKKAREHRTKPGPKAHKKEEGTTAGEGVSVKDLVARTAELQNAAVAFLRKTGDRHFAGQIRKAIGLPMVSTKEHHQFSDFMRRNILEPLVESQRIIRERGASNRTQTYRIND